MPTPKEPPKNSTAFLVLTILALTLSGCAPLGSSGPSPEARADCVQPARPDLTFHADDSGDSIWMTTEDAGKLRIWLDRVDVAFERCQQ